MSGDPLLWFVSSPYDVATCIRCGMCECEATCDQGLVIRHGMSIEDVTTDWRERALRAEAEVRELREAQGYLLGLSDHWYELWRKASNAVLRLDAELNG